VDPSIAVVALRGKALQYRNSSGSEVDAIIESGDGSWAAIEIKLGNAFVDQAAESLKKVKNKGFAGIYLQRLEKVLTLSQ